MKKMLAAAMTAMMVVAVAGTAMAAPVTVNGDVLVHYRVNTNDSSTDNDGGKVWFRLNAKTALSSSVDAYARFSTERLFADPAAAGLADFDRSAYDSYSVATFDRFGFIVKGNGFDYTIGRQDAFLGQGLLLDSTGYTGVNVGAFDGLTAAGKTGATNLKVLAGQAWTTSKEDPKFYAIDASYNPTKAWTVGGTLAKLDNPSGTEDANFWAINSAYGFGKASVFGEYAKSDVNANNKGYAFGSSYAFDDKNSFAAIYNRVENNAAFPNGLTTYDQNGKGMYYMYSHKFQKDLSLGFFYKDMETIAADGGTPAGYGYTSFRTTLTYKF